MSILEMVIVDSCQEIYNNGHTLTIHDLLERYDPDDVTIFVERCKEKFDRVYVGCSVTQLLTKGLMACLKGSQKVSVYLETSLYLLHMADQIQVKYKQYLAKFAKVSLGFILILSYMFYKLLFGLMKFYFLAGQ